MKNAGTIMIILLIWVAMSITCVKEDENHHKTIQFINNYYKSIYIYCSLEYPDTLNNRLWGTQNEPQIYKVDPNTENKSALWSRVFWETNFKNIPSDTLMVYTFDAELLEARITHEHDAIIQRYDLSLQDLQSLNWQLYYPPTVAMKDIKMWPPYEK